MKTLVRSLVIVIVMIFGTTTADATLVVDNDIETETLEAVISDIAQKKKKCVLNHIHNETCGGKYVVDRTKVYAGMNKKLRRHIFRGHHKYHRDVCRRCHLTRNEIRRMEPQVKKLVADMHSRKKAKNRKSRHPGIDTHNAVA